MSYEPFLSGNRLLTTQTFRDLFRTEVINTNEGIAIKDITFLFTDLKGSTALYEAIGDSKAYFLVRQHFDTLGRVIAASGGTIVKTIGDAVMAAFESPTNALIASVEMLREIKAFNAMISQELNLKIGIHRGHSIAVTLNEHIDYFGQTVNIAARVQALADANEIYITSEVYKASNVKDVIQARHVLSEQVSVKGISEKLQVYKIVL
jgi:class 3 adenylate cyclase